MRILCSVLVVPACLLALVLTACGGGGGGGSSSNHSAPSDAGGLWVGVWSGTGPATGVKGHVVAELHQSGTSLAGYAAIPYLGLSNTAVTGTVNGSSISFGDVSGVVHYSGTFSSATSASGTYHETSYGTDGTWYVNQLMTPFDDAAPTHSASGIWNATNASSMGQPVQNSVINVSQSGNDLSGIVTQGGSTYPMVGGRVAGTSCWFVTQPTPTLIAVAGGTLDANTANGSYVQYDTSVSPNLSDQGTWTAATNCTPLLYSHGALVTHPGGGNGGADASALQSGSLVMQTLGFGHSVSASFRIADSFTIADPGGWQIDEVVFYAYQTGSATSPSTITAVNYQIWNGSPDNPASTVVFGNTTTNRMTTSLWSNIYRVNETTLNATTRPIMANTCTAGIHLGPGTYWLDWQADGSLASGPWAPPITILGQAITGSGLQCDSGSWAPATDTGTGTPAQGFPFIIKGSILP